MKKNFVLAILTGSLLMTGALSLNACSDNNDPSINAVITSYCKHNAKCQADASNKEYSENDALDCFATQADILSDEIINKCESKINDYYSCLTNLACGEDGAKCSDKLDAFLNCTGLQKPATNI